MKSFDHICETYNKIISSRFQIIEKKGKMLLPCIYIKPDENIKKSFNGKIKVSVWQLLKSFGQGRGLIMRVAELTGNKNWKPASLIVLPDRNSCYTMQRIY